MRITIETSAKVPVATAWAAWTTPDDITQWNAASGYRVCPSADLDLRAGGRFSYRLEARDRTMGFDFEGTFARVVTQESTEVITDDGSVTVRGLPHPRGRGTRRAVQQVARAGVPAAGSGTVLMVTGREGIEQ